MAETIELRPLNKANPQWNSLSKRERIWTKFALTRKKGMARVLKVRSARPGEVAAKLAQRISAIAFALAAVVLFFPSSSPTLAQTPQSESQPQQPEAGVDDNPTRAVFFSVREEYRNLINGAWNNRLVLRKDAVVLKGDRVGGRTGFLLRTDVPITTTHLLVDAVVSIPYHLWIRRRQADVENQVKA